MSQTTRDQFDKLPLPAAHLIVDIRGVSDERVIEWLQVDVADLASGMQSENVFRWRYLRDFLSFRRVGLLEGLVDASEQNIDELLQEVNRIRANRIVAMQGTSRPGSDMGVQVENKFSRDKTVRVVFLALANNQKSLTCAALYAERLKNRARKLEHPGHWPLLNTTVLCVGNSEERVQSATLMQELSRNKA